MVSYDILLLVRELDHDDRLAHQLFRSAYVDRPQEEILNTCSRLDEKEFQQKLLELLKCNPFSHSEIKLAAGEA